MGFNPKWEDYFDKGIAFVIPKGEPNPCANRPAFTSWMVPMYILAVTPADPNCEPLEGSVKLSKFKQ